MNGDLAKQVKAHGVTGSITLSAGVLVGILYMGFNYKDEVNARIAKMDQSIAVSEQRLTASELRLNKLEDFIYQKLAKKE